MMVRDWPSFCVYSCGYCKVALTKSVSEKYVVLIVYKNHTSLIRITSSFCDDKIRKSGTKSLYDLD